jgi:hypothetical protein
MRIELRVCKHCLEGEHENEHKTAVTRDLVASARVIREHKEELDLDGVHIRKVTEDESDDGRPAAIPAVAATLQSEQVVVSDTQLVTMGENGYMLVYPTPQDALKVLAGNIDELSKVTDEDITPQLSPEGAEILAGDADEDDIDDDPMGGGSGGSPADDGPADDGIDDEDDIFY